MSKARSGGGGASSSASGNSDQKNPEKNTLVIENKREKTYPPPAVVGVPCPPRGSPPALPLPPLVCRCMAFASPRPWALGLWCGGGRVPRCPVIVADSTGNPPCEQLLAVAGAGAGPVVHVSSSLSSALLVVVVPASLFPFRRGLSIPVVVVWFWS
jgi:hypothetical protein